MAFTEFYCNPSTGSNMNGGSDENTSPSFADTNGNWNATTGVFTATKAVTGVTNGQFASVFLDGASAPVFIGRVTANDATTITVSLTACSGTPPATGATGRSINVGGVWKGPNAADIAPFNLITAAAKNAAGNIPRVNLKNNADYQISAVVAQNQTGPLWFQGYSSTAGDGGKAKIDTQTNVINGVTLSTQVALADLIVTSSAASGTSIGFSDGGSNLFFRCVAYGFRGRGFSTSNSAFLYECEAYSNRDIAFLGSYSVFVRCIAHDNTGGGGYGFYLGACTSLIDSVSDSNGSYGIYVEAAAYANVTGCDAYNNGNDGIRIASATCVGVSIENCNLVKNGGYGINNIPGAACPGIVHNCAFGAGTQANTSGDHNALGSIIEVGSIAYPDNVTPWVDPANGDFRINLAQAKGAGRGAFTQTAASYAGTVGYPDIGAAQHEETAGGGGFPILGGSIVR